MVYREYFCEEEGYEEGYLHLWNTMLDLQNKLKDRRRIMSKRNRRPLSDLEECKIKLNTLLREYNCLLMSADEYSNVLLLDKDTEKCVSAQENRE